MIVFLHEFGHTIAARLADTPDATLNTGFRWDFVEAPAQLLEQFAWNPAVLEELSANVASGAPLPRALIAKMIAARAFGAASLETHALHTTALGGFADGTIPQASFAHLMNGYEAQYYGYLWSEVYAQDVFSAFERDGLENAAVGARFRKDILAPARMIEPDAEVRTFLGRAPDRRAFYRRLGIMSATKSVAAPSDTFVMKNRSFADLMVGVLAYVSLTGLAAIAIEAAPSGHRAVAVADERWALPVKRRRRRVREDACRHCSGSGSC